MEDLKDKFKVYGFMDSFFLRCIREKDPYFGMTEEEIEQEKYKERIKDKFYIVSSV